MRILNFGSLNIDYVYSVEHFVRPGETISADAMQKFCGGKGLNQSAALARAGAQVYHAGCVGSDGRFLIEALKASGVHTQYVAELDEPSGHAVIQVDARGQNCILLYGGTNQRITDRQIDEVLSHFEAGDWLLLQNEVNNLPYVMEKAHKIGLKIAINPSPMNDKINVLPLETVDLFFLNEIEGEALTKKQDKDEIATRLLEKYPNASIVLTLGKQGAIYTDGQIEVFQPIIDAPVVDTTAAGDTFTGFFLQAVCEGKSPEEALKLATAASAVAVSRKGAMPSIPTRAEADALAAK